MWITRTSGFVEFSAFSWLALLQQTNTTQPSQPSLLDNPVTLAAFFSLLAGALIHFIPRIAGAVVKVIESLAGVVEQYYRNQKAKADAMTQQTEAMKNLFDQLEVERQRANASNARADKAIDASLASLAIANSATAQVSTLLTEKQAETDARKSAETALKEARKSAEEAVRAERERIRVLELQLAAMSAWNANVVNIERVKAEVQVEAETQRKAGS